MEMGTFAGHRARISQLRRLAGLLSVLLVGGCASPGPPRPPSLNLPEVVTSLTAERIGDRVRLHWSTPDKTTDGLEVRGPMTAVICRRTLVPPVPACLPVIRLRVVAGPSEVVDVLSSPLNEGPAAAVEYSLDVLNGKGRSAGKSQAVFAAAGAAPPPLQGFQAAASAEGAKLTWQPAADTDEIELHRANLSDAKTGSKPGLGKSKTKDADVVLRVSPGAGALDRTAQMGERYTYTAQRVRMVEVAGRRLMLRSAVSSPVTAEMRDTFPPRRPSGLEAVAGNGVVDLSWEPNTEPDLAGYIVQRQEDALAQPLNTSPAPQSSFQDKTAVPGHTYLYSVVAVDKAGNRSPASEPTRVPVSSDVP